MIIYSKNDLNIPFEGDKNQYNFCISRERQIELAILEYASQQLKSLFHAVVEENELDTPTVPFLIRTTIEFYNRTKYKNAPIAINNLFNRKLIENWPSHLPEKFKDQFLKRKILSTTLGTFINNKWLREQFVNNHQQIFCKTVLKEYGFATCAPALNKIPEDIALQNVHRGNLVPIIISEPISINQEYRTFVIDKIPICTSTYDDYDIIPIPNNVQKFIGELVENLNKLDDIPNNYVVDVAESDRGIVLIELNDVGLSGRYINNNFCSILENLLHVKIDKPYEEFVTEFDSKNINNHE